jgi:hypothetical protein
LEDRRVSIYAWESRRFRAHLWCRLALALNGKNHRMRVQTHTAAGDLVGCLQQHLGERLAVA